MSYRQDCVSPVEMVLGSLGFIIESLRVWKWKAIPLSTALTLFFTTTFLRFPINRWIGTDMCNMLFFTSLILIPLGLGIANLRKEAPKNELVTLTAIVWTLLWIGLASEGKRYDFFLSVPLAYYAQDLSMKQIATRLNRSEGTIKSHLRNARLQLQESLTPYLKNQHIP